MKKYIPFFKAGMMEELSYKAAIYSWVIISMPVENLMFDSVNPWVISVSIVLMALLFMCLSVAFWNVCVAKYESTGS